MPLLAAEGSHVLLAHNISENPLGYAWYRGESVDNTQLIASYRVATNATTNGAVYSRRETLYPNGTLLIQNVTQKDTGSYTLLVTKKDLQTERLTEHLCIYSECFLSDLGVLGGKVKVKVARSCPALCDPMDCSLPGFSVQEVLQARTLEWVPSPGNLPNPGIKPRPPVLQADSLLTEL